MIDQATRLKASQALVVVALHHLPEPEFWRDIRPAGLFTLREHICWVASQRRLDLGSLRDLLRSLRPPVPQEQWLTVTQCAQLLMKHLPGVTLEKAKARVSWAASTAKLVTNHASGGERRIERISFDAWRLEQRDRSLDDWEDNR